MQTVRHFFEMVRFSHTLFALPFALFSAVLAWYQKQAFSSPDKTEQFYIEIQIMPKLHEGLKFYRSKTPYLAVIYHLQLILQKL